MLKARHGDAGVGQLDFGNQAREADHTSAGTERQGELMTHLRIPEPPIFQRG